MAHIEGSPLYSVKLRSDGGWNCRVSPSTKTLAAFYAKFPPHTTPAFLVDLGSNYKALKADAAANVDKWPWKVISVQDLPYEEDSSAMEALLSQGWAAISYAWGEYLPTSPYKSRPVYEGSRADNGLPLAYVPDGASVKRTEEWNWKMHKSTEPSLSLNNLRKVILTMGKRFLWWDIACIPQRDFSGGFFADPSRQFEGPAWFSDEISPICIAEVTKQKFVYEKAAVGAVWIHKLDWGQTSTIKAMLTKAPVVPNLDSVKTMIHDIADPNVTKVDTENALKSVLGLTAAKPTLDEWMAAITKFINDLKAVRMEDAWFRSLWSFQEGRLLKKQAFADVNGKTLSLPNSVTVKGQVIPYPDIKVQSGQNVYLDTTFPSNNAITNMATLVASEISIAYVSLSIPKLAPRCVQPLVELWKKEKIPSTTPFGNAVADIASTGLLYYTEGMPLEKIVAARRSRYPSFWYADAFYAMIGVLGLVKTDDAHNYEMFDTGVYEKYKDDRALSFSRDEVAKNFFEALVRKYQWMMLLLAKKREESISSWRAISVGHFEVISYYCQGFIVGNEMKPNETSGSDFKPPHLTYDMNEDVINISPSLEPGTIAVPVANTAPLQIEYPKRQMISWVVNNVKGILQGPSASASLLQGKEADMTDLLAKFGDMAFKDAPAMGIYTLTDDAKDYVDPFIKSTGKVDDKPDTSMRPSNTVIFRATKLSDAGDPGDDSKVLLIPFRSLADDTISNFLPRPPAAAKPRSARCLLIKNVTSSATAPTNCTGVFGGIVDLYKVTCTEKALDTVSVKWQ